MARFSQLMRVTSLRLSVLFTLLFGLTAVGLVAFVSYNSNRLLISEIRSAAQEEVEELSSIYRRFGAGRLLIAVEQRSRAPGAYLYLVSDSSGRIITGNVRSVSPSVFRQEGWSRDPFDYEPLNDTEGTHRAIAQVFELPQGLSLLVGRDIGEASTFRSIAFQATALALALMVATGLLLWLLIGRRALARIDSVAQSSRRIIRGDLSQRLPQDGSGDEFDRLSESLNALLTKIETLDGGVRQMSDAIAHDLKTPLARLRARAEDALAERGEDAELEGIIADTDAILRTFNALLMISRIEAGAQAASLEPTDLSDLAKDVIDLLEPQVREAGVDLVAKIEDGVILRGNRELLAQLMINLLDNALKYGSQNRKAQLILSVDAVGDRPQLLVEDNGAGIASEDREKVLERFVRLEKSRSRPGTGLGLSLVNAIAKLHSAELSLEDAVPGLRVRLLFPGPKERE